MQKKVDWQQGTLSYQYHGNGKPVVLLHGFGEDSSIWDAQVAHLQKHCTVIVPDLPGTHDSHWQCSEESSIDDMAMAIHTLLIHEGINDCYLLGHSMGGYITLAFAEKFPQLLSGFGLIHSTAFADSEEKKQNRLRGIELMESYGGHQFLKATIPNLFGDAFKKEHPEQVEALMEKARHFPTQVLTAYYRAMMQRPDRSHVLKGNPLPVLFIIGTADVAAPLQDVLQQTHLPIQSYIHILDGIGHMGQLEATAQVNEYLLTFIQQ